MMQSITRFCAPLAGALFAAPVLANGTAGDGWHGMGWGWGAMAFGPLMMLIFFGGLVVVIALAIRWLSVPHSGVSGSRRSEALDILEERFARGEIDEQEFTERKRTLTR